MSRVARGGRRHRILVVGMLAAGLAMPGYARADDDAELAAIKAEMRRLSLRIQAIEARHGHARAKVPLGETSTGPAAARHVQRAAIAAPMPERSPAAASGPAPSPVSGPAPGPGSGPASGPAPRPETPSSWWRFPAIASGGRGGPGHIDLSSSSPAAITQTEVDHLPPIFSIGDISVRLGGFIELSNIWRSANLSSGPATAWNNFPYANNPNHRLDEERLSAQLSRMSVLMEAVPTKDVRLQAYVESDFGGAAGTSSSVQISGYTPRMRQGYFSFTQKAWGLHVTMGQAWSLATNYATGLVPRQEQLPAVTDNNQIPGIVFTRVPQIRIAKDWGEKYWLGLSIEDPQATVGFSRSIASGDLLPAARGAAGGVRVYYQNNGSVLLNSNAGYTFNSIPDIILKAATDTAFGHYELFGMARWFRDQTVAPGASASRNHTSFGGGVGAGVTMPLVGRKLQLAGNVLAGEGIGRYGPSQIPDATLNSRGELTPVPELIGSLGLIGHPAPSVLVYTYGGVETAGHRRYVGADGVQYGYGVTDADLAGCSVEFGTCNAQTRTLASFTTGGWWNILQGRYGNMTAGLQYTYIRKFAFRGNDGTQNATYPDTSGHTLYVSFRYFPFQ